MSLLPTSSSVSVTRGLRGADLLPVAASLETITNLACTKESMYCPHNLVNI